MSYDREPYTATEAVSRRIKDEESMTRAMTNAMRNANANSQRSSGVTGSFLDGLIVGAITLVFYGIYHLFRGLFLAVLWAFRRMTRSKS